MKSILLGTALAATLAVGAASASTFNTTYSPTGLYGPSNLKQSVNIHTTDSGYDGWASAGMYHMVGDGGVGEFLSFCVDLKQFLHDPATYTDTPTLLTSDIRSNIGKLFTSVMGNGTMGDVINTGLKAAGFQVALWEIVSDTGTGFDLTTGVFSVSGNAAAKQQAETYLSGVTPTALDNGYAVTYLFSPDHQDVVTGTPNGGGTTPVPLPASGLLLAFGLGGLFSARRRKS